MHKRTANAGWVFALFWTLAGFPDGLPVVADTVRPIDAIEDNSFLIEEAYNQEPGVVQHIFTGLYGEDRNSHPHQRSWNLSFTQEWPVFSQRHQFSYTIPFSFTREGRDHQDGIGDLLLNYRLQALEESAQIPAFAPRFSLIIPTGSRDEGTGNGVVGYQWSLPFSKKLGPRFAMHADLGLTYLPDTRVPVERKGEDDPLARHLSPEHSLVSYNLGASAVIAFSS
ncbi:MAG: transporter, partial [Deltaproteobacteria bacterium]|nr:transporter [Deltaproteobacteria bacterium]